MTIYSNLPFDVVNDICKSASADPKLLKSLSLVNKMTRAAAIPFLFCTIKWTQQWGDKHIAWSGAEAKVQVLLKNKEIMDAVRKFYFYPWVSKATESPIPTAFFSLMTALTGLETLELILQLEYLEQVKNEIGILPSVKTLIIPTPSWLPITKSCPNLVGLEVDNDRDRISAEDPKLFYASIASSHPGLTKLHVPRSPITAEITEIAKSFPGIEELGLSGSVAHRYTYGNEQSIVNYLPSFTLLPRLKTLYLPDLTDLGLGFNPPWCGNAYDHPGVAERVAKEEKEAMEKLVKGVEESVLCNEGGKSGCPLENLVVGRRSWTPGTTFVTEGKSRLKLLADH